MLQATYFGYISLFFLYFNFVVCFCVFAYIQRVEIYFFSVAEDIILPNTKCFIQVCPFWCAVRGVASSS